MNSLLRELPPEFSDEVRAQLRAKARRNGTAAFAHMSDEWVASQVRMLMRQDLWHEAFCTAARDRIMSLSLEVESLRAVAWQPIDTAPKDGTHILAYFDKDPVYRSEDPKDRVAVVRWSGEYTGWSMPGLGGLSPVLWQPITRPTIPTLNAGEHA